MKCINKSLRIVAMLIALCAMLSVAASASGPIARATFCPYCGGSLKVTTKQVHTDEVIGKCDDNPKQVHYKAYKYRVWTCNSCKEDVQETVIATGHYCVCHNGENECWCWD